jgi:hypothetical protein
VGDRERHRAGASGSRQLAPVTRIDLRQRESTSGGVDRSQATGIRHKTTLGPFDFVARMERPLLSIGSLLQRGRGRKGEAHTRQLNFLTVT